MPAPSSASITAGDSVLARCPVANASHPAASRPPGRQSRRASNKRLAFNRCAGQPSWRSRSASFLRTTPTSAPAAPMASRQTIEHSTSSASCRASTPCTICTATPVARHEVCIGTLVPATDSAMVRGDEPSRISTWRPVRAVMAAAVACSSVRLRWLYCSTAFKRT